MHLRLGEFLYGGSVNTKNVDSLLSKENIDGALGRRITRCGIIPDTC